MKTKISNMIRVEDPSEAVREYAKTLRLPNQEYEKKQRMGFWTGRTPKEIRLYEQDGNALVFPFGLLKELWPMVREGAWTLDFRQDETVDYGDKLNEPLLDYQEKAVEEMLKAKYGILKSPAGSGKTVCGLEIIRRYGKKALWLCHTADLLKQSMDRAKQFLPCDPELYGTITEGRINISQGITFSTIQTMCNVDLDRYRHEWDIVIVDECFPEDTKIATQDGIKRIKDVSLNDKVLTVNDENELEYKNVIRKYINVPGSLMTITLKDGTKVSCTSNHPILTKRGYVDAKDITTADELCHMRERNRLGNHERHKKIKDMQRETDSNMFCRMCKDQFAGILQKIKCATVRVQQKARIGTHEGAQSDVESGSKRKTEKTVERDGFQTNCSRWKWDRVEHSAKNNPQCVGRTQTDSRICCPHESKKRNWLSNMLQTGCCNTRQENWDRSRWRVSFVSKSSSRRQKENGVLEWVGVDRVEIQEQTGDGTYGGLCPDGHVYNLEVEGNHNYFANGINVHNCHHVSQSAKTVTRYHKVLNNLAVRRRYGISATPVRADGLIKATFALLGPLQYEVPDEAVQKRVMKVGIKQVQTDTEITDDCLNDDGTLQYTGLIEHLTTDADRNKLIARTIMENKGHSCIILSSRIAHLEAIRNLLPYEMQEQSAIITGKMTSKKAKSEREEILDKMRSGELKYLGASYNLFKEGVDIPRLDRLFLATPEKFSSVIIQSVGRIARVFEGKTQPIVYDFVDTNIGYCNRAYKERCRHYRKLDATFLTAMDELATERR